MERSRLKAFLLAKEDKMRSIFHLSKKLKFSDMTVRSWFKKYESEGLDAALRICSGVNHPSVFFTGNAKEYRKKAKRCEDHELLPM